MDVVAIKALFEQVLGEVSVRMAEAYLQAGVLDADHPLSQAGLSNGESVVSDYLDHNEVGIALEHLLYMVKEPPLELSPATEARLLELCQVYGIPR